MRSFLLLAALVATTIAMNVKMAPFLASESETAIPGSYIVVLNSDVTVETIHRHHATIGQLILSYNNNETNQVKHIYEHVFNGYSIKMNDELRDKIRYMPEVKYIERDQEVKILDCEDDSTNTQWGLPRISQEPVSEPDIYKYSPEDCSGEGVKVYIIDTGIYIDHDNLKGRASYGTDKTGEGDGDQNGHGTHVAGTSISNIYGVARKATAIAVKVLGRGGSGSYEGVIAGIDWVAEQHQDGDPSVINMSLGGGYSQAVNDAVEKAKEDGIVVVVAAGNTAGDACNLSPAGAGVIAVGATDQRDSLAYFSSIGTCVEILAPGDQIIAEWIGSSTATNRISGTSMASPHVAGAAARMLTATCNICTDKTPEGIESCLDGLSIPDVISNVPRDTVNKLLHVPCSR